MGSAWWSSIGPYSLFLGEFSDLIADFITHSDEILIIGDFNIHLNKAADPLSRVFQAIIDSYSFNQWVGEPTHCEGNTLDLILSYGVEVMAKVFLRPPQLCWTSVVIFLLGSRLH